MKAGFSHRTPAAGAFTILEMLVAMAVFMLMALMVVGLVDGTMRITSQSQRRIAARLDDKHDSRRDCRGRHPRRPCPQYAYEWVGLARSIQGLKY